MNKIKSFFINHMPSKRRLIQVYAALLYNANIKGFINGRIFQGDTKKVCVPGMNCYSCPGAIGSCPIGSLQNALSDSGKSFPFYVVGIILLQMLILGRTVCGWLCPFGLVQDLLYKIKTPKVKKGKVTRALSYLKYVLLGVFVIALPIIYNYLLKFPVPTFCKYICPIGTLEGALPLLINPFNELTVENLGLLFSWKFTLMLIILTSSIFIYRVFCRFLCPMGALLGLFNRFSVLGITVNEEKCNHCGKCVRDCKMDVKKVGDSECIVCGECKNGCPCHAIDYKALQRAIMKEPENKALSTLRKFVPLFMVIFLIAVFSIINFIL